MADFDPNFPTRQYPYRKPLVGAAESDSSPLVNSQLLTGGTVYRFVLGLDTRPVVMSDSEAHQELQDPFGSQLLRRGRFPLTLRDLLIEFNSAERPLSVESSFVVADGGQIAWTNETIGVSRNIRFAIQRANDAGDSVLISTGTRFDSESQFLQILAWDSTNEVFNYYERRAGTWIWAGNSYHSLKPPTRGMGPFDSHVNGSLVMKELKLPWTHWHSESSKISDDILAPDDPLRNEALWLSKQGADVFENEIVRPGIKKWTKSRVVKALPDTDRGVMQDPLVLLKHLFATTTFNLIASDLQSRSITSTSSVRLPITFFLDRDLLLDRIGIDPEVNNLSVSGEFYLESLQTFDFKLKTDGFEQSGDTHFAFIVPEPAFEDTQVVEELLNNNIISPRFAACVLMVDFANPISSSLRHGLLAHLPEVISFSNGEADLVARFVANVRTSQTTANDSTASTEAERRFLENWDLGEDWKPVFEERIEQYFASVEQRLNSQSGFDDYVRLAESRRREFRRRPLSEFDLTLPVTNIPNNASLLQMFEDGSVGPKQGS